MIKQRRGCYAWIITTTKQDFIITITKLPLQMAKRSVNSKIRIWKRIRVPLSRTALAILSFSSTARPNPTTNYRSCLLKRVIMILTRMSSCSLHSATASAKLQTQVDILKKAMSLLTLTRQCSNASKSMISPYQHLNPSVACSKLIRKSVAILPCHTCKAWWCKHRCPSNTTVVTEAAQSKT